MKRRLLFVPIIAIVMILAVAAPALACGGLIGPRGGVNLLRTTTLAGYHEGVEHYVTSFTFAGQASGSFGSIVPLPGVPTKVERGGDWTLQRLVKEVTPPPPRTRALFSATSKAIGDGPQILLRTKVDALDITVLKGGGSEVAQWAEKNGFTLSPDTPEVLDFYSVRSPIFMAARFDAAEAKRRGQLSGDGTPIHLTIPTPTPWVPLRILALGKEPAELVQADVFLLTDRAPAVLPAPQGVEQNGVPSSPGMVLARSERASDSLMLDLHNDKGMDWVPTSGMWLSYFKIDAPASAMTNDLAVDASGAGQPSWVAAGLGDRIGNVLRPIIRPISEPNENDGALAFWMAMLGLTIGIGLMKLARSKNAWE